MRRVSFLYIILICVVVENWFHGLRVLRLVICVTVRAQDDACCVGRNDLRTRIDHVLSFLDPGSLLGMSSNNLKSRKGPTKTQKSRARMSGELDPSAFFLSSLAMLYKARAGGGS